MESLQGLSQLGGTVATVVLFLYYLNKKDTVFNKIVSNHLEHSSKIIKENSKALTKVAVNIKELSLVIKNGKVLDKRRTVA